MGGGISSMRKGSSDGCRCILSGLGAWGDNESRIAKIRRLYAAAGIDGCLRERDLCALKVHFGERGCDTYVKPVLCTPGGGHGSSRGRAAVPHRYRHPLLGEPLQCRGPYCNSHRAWVRLFGGRGSHISRRLRSGHVVEVKAGRKHFERCISRAISPRLTAWWSSPTSRVTCSPASGGR